MFGRLFRAGGGAAAVIAPLETSVATSFTGALPALQSSLGGTLTWSKVSGAASITISAAGVPTLGTALAAGATASAVVRVSNGTDADERTLKLTGFVPVVLTATYGIGVSPASQAEGNAGTVGIVVTCTRSGDTSGAGTVDWTRTGTVDAADFQASTPAAGTFTFAAGQATATITQLVLGDTVSEGDEDAIYTLSNPTAIAGVTAAIGTASATARITDDDVVALTAGFYDAFLNDGAAVTLTGRTVQGKTYANPTNVNPNSLRVAASNAGVLLGGYGSSLGSNGWTYLPAGDGDTLVTYSTRGNLTSLGLHLTTGTVAKNARADYTFSGSAVTLTGYDVNGASGGGTPYKNLRVRPEDSLQFLLTAAGTATMFVNGYQVGGNPGSVVDLTALGITLPLTNNHGLSGKQAAVGNEVLNGFGIGNSATGCMLVLRQAARVLQREPDGSVVARLNGLFYGAAAAAANLRYSVIDLATRLPIAGHDHAALQVLTIAGMTFAGRTAPISAAAIAAATSGIQLWVHRTDVPGGGEWPSHGPAISVGEVGIVTGQSLAENMVLGGMAAGAAPLPSVPGWTVEANSSKGAADITPNTALTRRITPLAVDTCPAVLGKAVSDVYGGIATAQVYPCIGGQLTIQRAPGTANYDAAIEGLIKAGGRYHWGIDISGHFEIDASKTAPYYASVPAALADWKNLIAAMYNGFDAVAGSSGIVMIVPLGIVQNSSDVYSQQMRRLQWELWHDNPSRYFRGPWVLELQHNVIGSTNDKYHLKDTPNGVQAVRCATFLKAMLGATVALQNGAALTSAAKVSATSITVQMSDPEASALTAENMLYTTGDFRCGLDFASDSGFAGLIYPTGVAVGAAVAGVYPVTFDFAAALPATTYIRCMWGSEPLGRAATGFGGVESIRSDIFNRASQLRSAYADGTTCTAQPYFHVSGNDYVTAV